MTNTRGNSRRRINIDRQSELEIVVRALELISILVSGFGFSLSTRFFGLIFVFVLFLALSFWYSFFLSFFLSVFYASLLGLVSVCHLMLGDPRAVVLFIC